MAKTALLLTLLLVFFLLLAQPAPAVIYQCRDARGVLVITDDQDSLPANCRDRQERPEKEDLPAAPAVTNPATPGARSEGQAAPREMQPARKPESTGQRPEVQDEEKSPQTAPVRRGGSQP